jgi:hypothetical protein
MISNAGGEDRREIQEDEAASSARGMSDLVGLLVKVFDPLLRRDAVKPGSCPETEEARIQDMREGAAGLLAIHLTTRSAFMQSVTDMEWRDKAEWLADVVAGDPAALRDFEVGLSRLLEHALPELKSTPKWQGIRAFQVSSRGGER